MRERRHHAILRILDDHKVESQEQLQALLRDAGFDVNQGTLSRDLRALGVVKDPEPGGGARYRKVPMRIDPETAVGNLRSFLREMSCAGNLVVIKTRIGCAQPVGLALDQVGVEGLVGTVAGDDTVLAVVADGKSPRQVTRAIWQIIETGAAPS